VIQSKADQTVRPASAQVIYDRLGSRDKKLRWLRGSRHVATLDRERDLIHLLVSQHIRPST
jgi:carboxylesterase